MVNVQYVKNKYKIMSGRKKQKVYEYVSVDGIMARYKLNRVFESISEYSRYKLGKLRPMFRQNDCLLNKTTQLLKDKTIISLKKINRHDIYKLLSYYYSPYVNRTWGGHKNKRIYCYDLKGRKVATFRDLQDASNLLGVESSTIVSRIATGGRGKVDNPKLFGLTFKI